MLIIDFENLTCPIFDSFDPILLTQGRLYQETSLYYTILKKILLEGWTITVAFASDWRQLYG